MSVRWYVPCSVKYSIWSRFFRILSVELWFVLIILIVTAAIWTTLVWRESCKYQWQGYNVLTSSLTNVWPVILVVEMWMIQRSPCLRSPFPPGCVSLWSYAQFSSHFTHHFLLTRGNKHQFKTWKFCSLQVLSFPNNMNKIPFFKKWRNRIIKILKIVWIVHRLMCVWNW